MKLGMNTFFVMKFERDEALQFCREIGVTALELAAIGPAAKRFCDIDRLLGDSEARNRWLDNYANLGFEIYSFAAHGSPLHPDNQIAETYSRQFRNVCTFMEKIGATRLCLVAGLPEGREGDTLPNWIVNTDLPGSDLLKDALEWQWNERLLPYWREHGKFAADHGVTLCFEMQVNDMIHNPVKLRQLRDEIGPVVASNFDISHMWAQKIDPLEAIHYLGDLIQAVHLKDTLIHAPNARLRGLMDTTHPLHPDKRAWSFTLPGWGHDERTWREVITALRFVGYEGILTLEHESEYMEIQSGLEKSAAFIRTMLLDVPPGISWRHAAE